MVSFKSRQFAANSPQNCLVGLFPPKSPAFPRAAEIENAAPGKAPAAASAKRISGAQLET